jgi:hypothetical protein
MATTDHADTFDQQLLERGWAPIGEPPSPAPAGRLVIRSHRLQVVVDDQPLLDGLSPYAPDGLRQPSTLDRSHRRPRVVPGNQEEVVNGLAPQPRRPLVFQEWASRQIAVRVPCRCSRRVTMGRCTTAPSQAIPIRPKRTPP